MTSVRANVIGGTREPPPPMVACWMVTNRCNMECIHCEPGSGARAEAPGLSFDEQVRVVERLAAGGVEIVLLSGGEPLMLPRIFDLIDVIRGHGLEVWISTNGSLTDEATARRIADRQVLGVVVGLDSCEPSVHDLIRGHPGAHARAVAGIEALRRLGVTVNTNYVPTQITRRNLGGLQRLASDLGVKSVLVNRFRPLGRGRRNAKELVLSLEEYRGVVDEFLGCDVRGGSDILFEDPAVHAYCRAVGAETAALAGSCYGLCGCQAGIVCLGLQPNGDIVPCAFLHGTVGNIMQDDPRTIVGRSAQIRRLLDRNDRGGRCGTCPERRRCGGCRAHASAEHGDWFAEDPFCLYTLVHDTTR